MTDQNSGKEYNYPLEQANRNLKTRFLSFHIFLETLIEAKVHIYSSSSFHEHRRSEGLFVYFTSFSTVLHGYVGG